MVETRISPIAKSEVEIRLKNFRKDKRLSQSDVAKFGQCSRSTVARYEGFDAGLPKKFPLTREQDRKDFVLLLLAGYRLLREEADEILSILRMGKISEAEWAEFRSPLLPRSVLVQSNRHQEGNERFEVRMGQYGYNMMNGDLRQAYKFAEEFLSLAELSEDLSLLIEGHCALGMVLFHLGALRESRIQFEQAEEINMSVPYTPRTSLAAIGHPLVISASHLSHLLLLLGHPDEAVRKCRKASALERVLDPQTSGRGYFFASILHQLRRDFSLAKIYAQTAISNAGVSAPTHWQCKSLIVLGWSMAMEGEIHSGIRNMKKGVADLKNAQGMTVDLALPCFLTMLAEGYLFINEVELGLATISEAKELTQNRGSRILEAESYRIEGNLYWCAGDTANAEQSFGESIKIAHRQKSILFELRTATHLARLCEADGRLEDALVRLSKAYAQFEEGFDTRDLLEARELLHGPATLV